MKSRKLIEKLKLYKEESNTTVHTAAENLGDGTPCPPQIGKLLCGGYLPSPCDFDPYRVRDPELRIPPDYLIRVAYTSGDQFVRLAKALRNLRTRGRASHLGQEDLLLKPSCDPHEEELRDLIAKIDDTSGAKIVCDALELASKLSSCDRLIELVEFIALDFVATNPAGSIPIEGKLICLEAIERHLGLNIVAFDDSTKEAVYGLDTLEQAARGDGGVAVKLLEESMSSPTPANPETKKESNMEQAWFLACARLGLTAEKADQMIRGLEIVDVYLPGANDTIPPPAILWELGSVMSRKPWATSLFEQLVGRHWRLGEVAPDQMLISIDEALLKAKRRSQRDGIVCSIRLRDGRLKKILGNKSLPMLNFKTSDAEVR